MSFNLLTAGAVDSTNLEALRQLKSGAQPPFLLVAEEQLQGRGRGGNAWSSPPGNFYGTFAIRAEKPDPEMAQMSFVAALALAQVLEGLGLKPQLKWPNDILIKGAKISGILLEKHGSILLVGMGINVQDHPGKPDYPTTSLRDLDVALEVSELAAQLSEAVSTHFDTWVRAGFAPVRDAWIARAYGLNGQIRVRLAGQVERQGVFRGLDTDGALQLETSDGLEAIHAGEVYFNAFGD